MILVVIFPAELVETVFGVEVEQELVILVILARMEQMAVAEVQVLHMVEIQLAEMVELV